MFLPSGRRTMVGNGETLLVVARRLGVDIESICGGRLTCAKCKVRIDEGSFPKHGLRSSASHLSVIGDKESSLLTQANSSETTVTRLACATTVCGDVLVYVPEESRAHKQTIRKVAGERVINVEPAVRQVYVEVDAAQLGEHRGDWGRLQSALHSQWNLSNLQIDLIALRKLQSALRQWKSKFRVIGEERWSDQWSIDLATSDGELPQHLAAGICGSGIIEVVAELLMAGIINGDGRFNTSRRHARMIQQGRAAAYILARGTEPPASAPSSSLKTIFGMCNWRKRPCIRGSSC